MRRFSRASSKTHWQQIIPFFDQPPEIHKIIYTTNAIESLNASLRKISRKRTRSTVPNWHDALNRFTIELADRMPPAN